MYHDGIFYAVGVFLPDLAVDFFGREYVTGVLHEEFHDFVFGCSQADGFAVDEKFFGVSVQEQAAVFEDVLILSCSACGSE